MVVKKFGDVSIGCNGLVVVLYINGSSEACDVVADWGWKGKVISLMCLCNV